MCRTLSLFVAIASIALLPQFAAAEKPDRPDRPNPAKLFDRLDANDDGKVTADEVPEGAPERLKQMLIRADANKDKTLTKEEFKEAIKRRAGGPPHHGGADRHRGPERRPGPPHGMPPHTAMAMMAKHIFEQADANDDGKVTKDEAMSFHRERFEKLLEKGDKDSDGALSKEEAREALKEIAKEKREEMAKKVGQTMHQRLMKLDANEDGKVTVDEMPEGRREWFKKLLEKADADGDGALSQVEAKKAAAKLVERMKEGPRPSHHKAKAKCGPKGKKEKGEKKEATE